ncbi:aminotransferase class I/II-fold pyridoxal phosphate-dependent enzyme [Yunchengibacter salinarum]|uniref:aminotransferase class I/II-fold pyridoxal phosphate-dependent enzyme n=1 Tax=Yunchengibacter salinarum TaxID=3133399 RepID=UPI0035B63D45
MSHDPHHSLTAFANAKLAALEARHQRRALRETARGPAMTSRVSGARRVSFTDNDYLGLSTDPETVAASVAATQRYGAGSGASRLVTGNHPLYTAVEERLARLKGAQAAIVFGSGYLANSGIIPALAGRGDLILADEKVHACIHAGIRLSPAEATFFRHNDTDHLARLLAEKRGAARHVLIVVDGIYSMDGDMAPLAALADLADQYDAWLMSDDAHGLGTVGDGRGAAHACGVADRVPLKMGTLSKAAGAYGGYLAAPAPVIELMKSRARSLIYTTGLPPGVLGAADKALEIIETDKARIARPMALARHFCTALGLPAPESPIVPLILGSEQRALDGAAALRERGFDVIAFRPPTVAPGTARLRFSFSATHRDADVDGLIAALNELNLSPLAQETA